VRLDEGFGLGIGAGVGDDVAYGVFDWVDLSGILLVIAPDRGDWARLVMAWQWRVRKQWAPRTKAMHRGRMPLGYGLV